MGVVTKPVFINGSDDLTNDSLDIDGSGSPVIDVADIINDWPMASSPPRSVFPICFNDLVISPRRICTTSLRMAQLAETILEDATAEYLRTDDFGRDIYQQEMTAK